jgi:anti-anti-sigma factor
MEIQEEQIGDTHVVTMKGRLDGIASPAFADRIGALINHPNPRLLVDLAAVDLVTSAGLRVVLLILKRVKAGGGAFALCNVQPSVREVLDISGFTAMLSIHGDRAEGITALAGKS